MKVLHVTNLYPSPSNVAYGTFIKEQIDSLINLGVDCEVVFIDARAKGKSQYLKKINEIRKRAKKKDLIHCHHTYTGFATLGFARVSKPVVTSFLGPAGKEGRSDRFQHLKKSMYRYVMNRSRACIVKDHPPSSALNKIHYLPNGVDLDAFKELKREIAFQRLRIPPRDYILFCSSADLLRKEKRYDLFNETTRILKNKYNHNFEELILRNQPRRLVPYYFNASRVHLLTSDYEGSPNSVKEALACNIPVVSTDVGNVKSMLSGVEGCYVALCNDPEELAGRVNRALKFQRIKGRERLIHLKLDMTSIAHRLIKIYTGILAENRPSPLI